MLSTVVNQMDCVSNTLDHVAWLLRTSFVTSHGWQTIVAGVAAGILVHSFVYSLRYAGKRQWPGIPTSFYVIKLLSWVIIPYAVIPEIGLLSFQWEGRVGLTQPVLFYLLSPQHEHHRWLLMVLLSSVVRYPGLLLCKRKDLLLYETLAILLEALVVLSPISWAFIWAD